MTRGLWLICLTLCMPAFAQQAERRVPDIDELLSIRTMGGATISPGGRWIAYSISGVDFEADANRSQLWLMDVDSGESFQLTRGPNSASGPRWSPDGRWLAFTTSREGSRTQIFAIRPAGGEAIQLTEAESGASNVRWSPNGTQIAFTATEPREAAWDERDEYYGEYSVVRREYRHRHVFTIDIEDALESPAEPVQRTSGEDFNVRSIAWSPDGTKIAFDATVNPDLIQGDTSDIYVLDLSGGEVTRIVDLPGPDRGPRWSPDGSQLIFSSAMGREDRHARNSRLAIVPAAGGEARSITDDFDENPRFVEWNADGIYFSGSVKTATHLFRVDPAGERIERVTGPDELMAGSFSLTADGRTLAFTASAPAEMTELFITGVDDFDPLKLTNMSSEVEEFLLGSRELIQWESRDGTMIEGVLIKPVDFDPRVLRPLLCVIHGGPTGIDRPSLPAKGRRTYPVDIWSARGALILMVNYRGSSGYGEDFRRLNIRNLGIGDAWDVTSGVDHLIAQGWVDPGKIGCMGWSQGGYISAFLTASTERFAAISVGAGISNWATYYYNTDITTFTINYLGDNPIDDPDIYTRTSPMSYIQWAKTPTLIQHGEFDRRVPIPNAYELRQGLEDRGVPVEMIVYAGFGHGVNTPRAQRAVMRHNLEWFNHHIWGDPAPDFTRPAIPDGSPGDSASGAGDKGER